MAFHNHMQYAEEGFSCDPILAVSPSIMLNFDAGHFFGSTGIHPNEMIKKYHDRIYSIHLKDGAYDREPAEYESSMGTRGDAVGRRALVDQTREMAYLLRYRTGI